MSVRNTRRKSVRDFLSCLYILKEQCQGVGTADSNIIEGGFAVCKAVLNLIINQNELSDKAKVLELIKSGNMVLEKLSDEFKNDKEIVLESVKIAGSQLKYASEELRNDKEVVLQAVKTYGRALEFASDELKNDRQIVLESVKNNGLSLKYASEQLKNTPQMLTIFNIWGILFFLYFNYANKFCEYFHGRAQ